MKQIIFSALTVALLVIILGCNRSRAEKRKANLTHSHNVELAKEFISGDILEFYLAGLFYHQKMRREIDVNLQAIFEQFNNDFPESKYLPFVSEIYMEMITD